MSATLFAPVNVGFLPDGPGPGPSLPAEVGDHCGVVWGDQNDGPLQDLEALVTAPISSTLMWRKCSCVDHYLFRESFPKCAPHPFFASICWQSGGAGGKVARTPLVVSWASHH